MEFSDEQARGLLQRIATGDENALAALHQQLHRSIYAFALNRLHDEHEAKGVANDTLYEVWKSAARFRGDSEVRTWILGIARYKLLTVLRRQPAGQDEWDDELNETLASHDLTPLEHLEAQERKELVRHCLERLRDIHRECLHLVFFQELPLAEIAKIQECPEDTVKTRLFHARKNVRKCVEWRLRAEGGRRAEKGGGQDG